MKLNGTGARQEGKPHIYKMPGIGWIAGAAHGEGYSREEVPLDLVEKAEEFAESLKERGI